MATDELVARAAAVRPMMTSMPSMLPSRWHGSATHLPLGTPSAHRCGHHQVPFGRDAYEHIDGRAISDGQVDRGSRGITGRG